MTQGWSLSRAKPRDPGLLTAAPLGLDPSVMFSVCSLWPICFWLSANRPFRALKASYGEGGTEAKEKGIEGKVLVSFVVDNKGNIKDISLTKSANEFLDKEALRVVKSMPKWNPGKKDNKKVNVKLTLPISFKL